MILLSISINEYCVYIYSVSTKITNSFAVLYILVAFEIIQRHILRKIFFI